METAGGQEVEFRGEVLGGSRKRRMEAAGGQEVELRGGFGGGGE